MPISQEFPDETRSVAFEGNAHISALHLLPAKSEYRDLKADEHQRLLMIDMLRNEAHGEGFPIHKAATALALNHGYKTEADSIGPVRQRLTLMVKGGTPKLRRFIRSLEEQGILSYDDARSAIGTFRLHSERELRDQTEELVLADPKSWQGSYI